jgi:O-antigen/teichoic acid export membrane protein
LLKNKLLIRLFSSGLQAIAVQVLAAAFFYLISIYLSKDNFGMISWMNAMSTFLTTVLGLGLEQVVTRRIAASNRSDWAAAALLWHSVTGFIITLAILLIINVMVKNAAGVLHYLPWFFAAQGLIYMGIPLKQFLNAKERFTPYAIIAMISNSCKIIAAYWLMQLHLLNTATVTITLISTSGFEFISLLTYIIIKTNFGFRFYFKAYLKLIRESAAQYISVIFDISLSRMDWILLGTMATNAVLADYSFAYRASELARLPMYIIAPMILPRFSRLLAGGNKPDAQQQLQIVSFNSTVLFFAALIPLSLNILWTPLVGLITHGKYGATNSLQFFILSLGIPFLFFINLLWSVSFSAKKYRSVTSITVACAVVNIVLNLVLIPKFNGLGASVAFLITTLLQVVLYYRLVGRQVMLVSLRPLIVFTALAGIIYFIIIRLNVHFAVQLLIAVALYIFIGLISKQITKQHLYNFKQFLS